MLQHAHLRNLQTNRYSGQGGNLKKWVRICFRQGEKYLSPWIPAESKLEVDRIAEASAMAEGYPKPISEVPRDHYPIPG